MGGTDGCVRAQDRDELARLITAHNAAKNHVPQAELSAFAEPLLSGGEGGLWDLILTNIPAKAGAPVLEDFVHRSASLLNPKGRVVMVVVNTLADVIRREIAAGAYLEREEIGHEHTVFVYRGKTGDCNCVSADSPAGIPAPAPVNAGAGFLANYPFYVRNAVDCEIEEIPLHLETIYGAADFDQPGGAALAAAKLAKRAGPAKLNIFANPPLCETNIENARYAPVLIHEPGQGFFPCFLLEWLYKGMWQLPALVLSGRNVLALEAARRNCDTAGHSCGGAIAVPAADLALGRSVLQKAAGECAGLNDGRFDFIAVFPELLPQSSLSKEADQLASLWESLPPLLSSGGAVLAAFSSTDAERFDRKKPSGFTRMGDIKRKGFRALAYQQNLPFRS
jgi:hypothetical protein